MTGALGRICSRDRLTVGLMAPIVTYGHDLIGSDNHVHFVRQADALGFAGLWIRDIPIFEPTQNDIGQVFDPWAYLGYVAANTSKIVLGTACIVTPLRHPLHIAKAAASIDQLCTGRFVLGLGTGERESDYQVFEKDFSSRSTRLRECVATLRVAFKRDERLAYRDSVDARNIIPKPYNDPFPIMLVGYAGQSIDWIASHSEAWLYHGVPHSDMSKLIAEWRVTVERSCSGIFKPFLTASYINLDFNADKEPHYDGRSLRLGRNHLIGFLRKQENMGVNHHIMSLRYCERSRSDVLEELARYVLPEFASPDVQTEG
ncbi:MAG TPA: TIGR03571 family LLM class oxidoreductase [Bryobacteraceae bacterium]|nr:TIGR03571 family LLM class oxidoreductase [Bryobacteraceae bacterium]